MNKFAAILVAGTAAAVATPAMAQDNTPFTGPRVEVLGGYDVSKAGSTVDDDTNEDNDQSIEGVDVEEGDFEGFGLGEVETGRDLYVGARVGVLAQPDLLIYAKGGYTNARYNVESSFDGEQYNSKIDTDGFRVGAGVEYALNQNTFAKVEYRYSNYSDAELNFEGDAPDVELGEIDTDRHQVMVGFGYRF